MFALVSLRVSFVVLEKKVEEEWSKIKGLRDTALVLRYEGCERFKKAATSLPRGGENVLCRKRR